MTRRTAHFHEYEWFPPLEVTCTYRWRGCSCGKIYKQKAIPWRRSGLPLFGCNWEYTYCPLHPDKMLKVSQSRFRTGEQVAKNTIKYAIFWRVNGEWRGGDFYTPSPDIPEEKQIAAMREQCESENGKGTFRSYAFLDEPHKKEPSPESGSSTVGALLNEEMGKP